MSALEIKDTALAARTELSPSRMQEEDGYLRVVYMAFYDGTLAPGSAHFAAMVAHHRRRGVDLMVTRPWERLDRERRGWS